MLDKKNKFYTGCDRKKEAGRVRIGNSGYYLKNPFRDHSHSKD